MSSRHIPKGIDQKIKEAAGFKCAWCGVHLTERHHIEPFYITQEHTEENLILLCPNCHTEAGSKKISQSELVKRRLSLTGKIDRSSGSLSIQQGNINVDVGGNHFLNCKNILMFNDNPLISVENDNGYLLVSMKIYSEIGNLICWMSKNRWWVEGGAIKDFIHSKNSLKIVDENNEPILNLVISSRLIEIQGYLFIKGKKISFSKDNIELPGANRFIGNTFQNLNAIVFSDNQSRAVGPIGVLISI